jgi:branched-chain amino acid transport system substrate-binding protein
MTVGTLATVALAACGTRLPNQSFEPRAVLGSQAAGVQADQASGPAAVTDAPGGNVVPNGAAATGDPGATNAVGPGTGVAPGGVTTTRTTTTSVPNGTATGPGVSRPQAGKTTATGPTKRTTTAPTKAGGVNTASDRGVTPTSILVGNLVSAGGIFGPEQFAVSKYGVLAYFADLNSRGGINGRKNVDQVNQAVDTDKIFAFIGNNIFSYDGADKVQSSATPEIGAQPIKAVYYKYSHFFNLLGTNVPRDNQTLGYNGYNYGSDEIGRFFKDKVGSTKVGVVYYDQADSRRGAEVFGKSFESAGLTVKLYPVNLGLPNFPNTVAQMQADGIDTVSDAMDTNGNAKLCQAMEGNSTFIGQVKAKISTISTWNQRIPKEFSQTAKCRNLIFVTGSTRSYNDISNPEVAAFRTAMKKYFPSREQLMAQWTFEGWLAGRIFTEAATSCGVNLTRACVEAFLNTPARNLQYQGTSDTSTFSWYQRPESDYTKKETHCVSVGRWSDAIGTFETVGDIQKDCYLATYFKYLIT